MTKNSSVITNSFRNYMIIILEIILLIMTLVMMILVGIKLITYHDYK